MQVMVYFKVLLPSLERPRPCDSLGLVLCANEMHICCYTGNLFFQDFTSFTSVNRLKTWDRRFAALKAFPNVLITPHSAFLTNEALQNIANSTVVNIEQFCDGEEITNEVRPIK